jgi:hypothetical protein
MPISNLRKNLLACVKLIELVIYFGKNLKPSTHGKNSSNNQSGNQHS